MKIGALVPARIGSKRLPKKNIKVLGDKPLICWTIDVLLEADIFSDITVSSESEEVMDVVRQYYSEKEVRILKRPEELAQDDSPIRDVIFHYLENRPELAWYGVFLPTFPFRKKEKLLEAYEAILSRYPWRIKCLFHKQHCLLDFYYAVEKGVNHFFKRPPLYARYSVPVYQLNSIKYREEMLHTYGLTPFERTYYIILNNIEELVDIDTLEDFEFAEYFLKNKEEILFNIKRLSILIEIDIDKKWKLICPSGSNIELILKQVENKLKNYYLPILVLKNKM